MNIFALVVLFCALVKNVLGQTEEEPLVTVKVQLHLTVGGLPGGILELGLFGNDLPITTKNFLSLCEKTKPFGYRNLHFYRITKYAYAQSGDFVNEDGTGGYSSFGKKYFEDESFKWKHYSGGFLAMLNYDKDKNSSIFVISFRECFWLNNKNVVFGKVISGYNKIVKKTMRKAKLDEHESPVSKILISNCTWETLKEPFYVSTYEPNN